MYYSQPQYNHFYNYLVVLGVAKLRYRSNIQRRKKSANGQLEVLQWVLELFLLLSKQSQSATVYDTMEGMK
jgi:hypothetical protein